MDKAEPALPRVRTPGDLRRLSDEDLRRHVETTNHTVTAGDVLQELYRRAEDRRSQLLIWLTVAIFAFTAIVAVATVLLLVRA